MTKPKMTDLQNIATRNFGLVPKSVGVLLHDTGFLRYKKLTPENYDYWWYEVDNPTERICPFAYDWADMDVMPKFDILLSLVKYHKPQENIYGVISNCLNLIEAKRDGINLQTGRTCYDEVFELYYGWWKPELKQLELFNNKTE
jgi:hypothetical protein